MTNLILQISLDIIIYIHMYMYRYMNKRTIFFILRLQHILKYLILLFYLHIYQNKQTKEQQQKIKIINKIL